MATIPPNANLMDLAFQLDASDTALCEQLDPLLANKLETIEDLKDMYFYLRQGNLCNVMPQTRVKVNNLLTDFLKEDKIHWKFFDKLQRWLDDTVKTKLVDAWLESDDVDPESMWIGKSIPPAHKHSLKALQRFVDIYKARRTTSNLEIIESLFKNIDDDRLDEACEVIAKSTPAISSMLLSRPGVPDKYTIKGLKSMSKLSKQRSIDVKIDFDMLKHLGPRSRLDAMKQLLGMMDKWNASKRDLPFKKMPTKEEVEFFLFPCSVKYNDEVVDLVGHFSNLTSQRR